MTLLTIAARTRTLLLDFDGPICSVFAGYPAPLVAAELRDLLTAHRGGVAALLAELDDADDPMRVLRVAGDLGDEKLTRTIADALRDAEVKASQSAEPTPGIDRVIEAARATGRRLGVVSNNSWEAVTTYCERVGLFPHLDAAIGRYDGMAPALMKPDGHLVQLALTGLDANPALTTLVGDMVSDVEAAHSLGLVCVGYANKPGKTERLGAAGADAIVTTMDQVADALLATPIG
jgi:phosphoglycolate phosphatase